MTQMTQERREAYVEVLEALSHMDNKYVDKVPLKLREFFKNNASNEYRFHIDLSVPLEEYKFKEITLNVLAMLNLNYWCESEEHKKELLNQYYQNELKNQEKLREKYNTDNLFKKKEKIIPVSESEIISNLPQQYEKIKWPNKAYNIILNFIKKLLNKQ